jgi:hypothetical protein
MMVRPRKRAALLLGPPIGLDIPAGGVEDVIDVVRRQPLNPSKKPVTELGLGGASVHEPSTIGPVPPTRTNENQSVRY